MKLTIVIDTEDERGIRDSFKIIDHFYKRINAPGKYTGRQVQYGKIAFIKMLRSFAADARDAEIDGVESTSLRFTKTWADAVFSKNDGI